jgi:hypothetical protein
MHTIRSCSVAAGPYRGFFFYHGLRSANFPGERAMGRAARVYARRMDGEREPEQGGPGAATGARDGPEAQRRLAGPAGAPERYGPLRLERFRKDDGRALILYDADQDGRGAAHG